MDGSMLSVGIQLGGLVIATGTIIYRMARSEAKRDQELDDHARRLDVLETSMVTRRELELMHESFQDSIKELISSMDKRFNATEQRIKEQVQELRRQK